MRIAVLASLAAFALLSACEKEVILTGERLDLRADLSADDPGALSADGSDRALPISLPVQTVLSSWPQTAGGPLHAMPHAALSAAPRLVWAAAVGQGEDRRHRITADPVVGGGRIFTVDSRARVTATSPGGQTLWSADLTPPADNPDDASGAGLALAGGRLFVSLGFGDLVALDAATGREIWRQDLDAAAGGAPTVAGGLVYLSSRDARGWAVEADTGRVRWTLQGTPGQAGLVGGAAPAVTDRLAIFPFSSAELTAALREGGTAIWTANVAGRRPGRVYARISDISGDPVVAGNRIYAGSAAGRLDAVDLSSGEVLWSAREGAMSPVVVAGGAVFAVTDQAELVRLDAGSGARVWSAPLPYFQRLDPRRRKDVFAHYGPVLAGGRLWVASGDGQLRGFSPVDGALAATVAIPGGAATAPVVAGRTLYVVSQRGQLLAFR